MDYGSRAKDIVFNDNTKRWGFAHMAEALNGICNGNQNVLMRGNSLDIQQNKDRKGDSSSFSSGNRSIFASTVLPFIPETNEFLKESNSTSSMMEIEKDIPLGWKAFDNKQSLKTSLPKKVAEAILVNTSIAINSRMEEEVTWNQSVNPDAESNTGQRGYVQFDSDLILKKNDGNSVYPCVQQSGYVQPDKDFLLKKSGENSLIPNVKESGYVRFGSDVLLKRSERNLGNSTTEQSRYVQQFDKDKIYIGSERNSVRVFRQRKENNEEVENSWDFDLVSDKLPSLISETHLFSLGLLPSQVCLMSSKSGPWKVTMSKIAPFQNGSITSSPSTRIDGIHKHNYMPLSKKKQNSETEKRRKIPRNRIMKQLLCGAFAGVVSRTAVAPLELIKVRKNHDQDDI